MSYTTMYGANEEGELVSMREYGNGWGSAPVIWGALGEKYKVWQLDSDGKRVDDMKQRPPYFNMIGAEPLASLCAYANKGGEMRPWEHNSLTMTLDNVIVERADFRCLGESLTIFEQAHAQPRHICHLASIAKDLDALFDEGVSAVAWNHASVGEFWGLVKAWEADKAAANGELDEDREPRLYNILKDDGHWRADILTPVLGEFASFDTAAE